LEYLFQQNLNLPLNNKKMIRRSYRRQIPEAQAFFFLSFSLEKNVSKKTKRADFSLSIQSRADG
jgi:hypothetical protein